MKALLEEMLGEVGAQILYYTDVVDVIRNGSRIESVVIFNKDGLQTLSAQSFIDTTGDGDLCHYAGVPSELGDQNGGLAAASPEMHVDGVDEAAGIAAKLAHGCFRKVNTSALKAKIAAYGGITEMNPGV